MLNLAKGYSPSEDTDDMESPTKFIKENFHKPTEEESMNQTNANIMGDTMQFSEKDSSLAQLNNTAEQISLFGKKHILKEETKEGNNVVSFDE